LQSQTKALPSQELDIEKRHKIANLENTYITKAPAHDGKGSKGATGPQGLLRDPYQVKMQFQKEQTNLFTLKELWC